MTGDDTEALNLLNENTVIPIQANEGEVRSGGNAGVPHYDSLPIPVSVFPHDSKRAEARFEIGLRSLPYLGDHGFHGMLVIPGSLFIQLALRLHTESLHSKAGNIRRIEFQSPVILSEGNAQLSVDITWLDEQTVRYAFHDTDEGSSSTALGIPCATLEIQCNPSEETGVPVVRVEEFKRRTVHASEQADFYKRLRENGNHYGPHFQTMRQVWKTDDEALGRLHFKRDLPGGEHRQLHPVLLDGITQLLSCFFIDQGRTFILKGADTVCFARDEVADQIWVHARLRSQNPPNANSWAGDLDAFDDSGLLVLSARGVTFTYIHPPESQEISTQPTTRIVITSTFTAEPVEDSLRFWGEQLELPVQVQFGPYNQVFQELLNPHSQLRSNREGFNAILVNLADWAIDGGSSRLKLNPQRLASCFGDLEKYSLPNGLDVAHLNRHETEHLYSEIFDDLCYLRHGICLENDATVIDIGANIGLFSLFVREHCPRGTVFAFEPSPAAFRVLQANCEAYGPGLYPFNLGVSHRRGSASLTCYEKSSVFSTFHAIEDEDRDAIRAVVANKIRVELGDLAEALNEDVEELMKGRLSHQTIECPLISVSDIIRENGLQRVHLLKVDAEKSELEILRGIADELWPRIDQVVVEVHDRTGRALSEVQAILGKQGFRCALEEQRMLKGSGLFNIYATRGEDGSLHGDTRLLVPAPVAELKAKVDQFVQALDSFTQASNTSSVLCLCPARVRNSHRTVSEQDLAVIEGQLLSRVRKFPGLEVISSDAILRRYPTAAFHDPHAHELGHIPYTPEGFAAIGSSLFRTFMGSRRVPYKVIVLDCDNTLWLGACGEVGPDGVSITPAHCKLHEFIKMQASAGMLLCLCSKNSEADVWAVFEQHPNMPLRREHFAASRINWSPKSDNLRSIARELGLGVESMIFVDDNPVECAEVRAKAPEVVTLQLPQDPGRWPQFLKHAWVFDHLRGTEEDGTRTQKMLENAQRENFRGQVATLKDFIDGLELQVTLFEPVHDQLGRASQLTLRTNQFNVSGIRRSESELRRYLQEQNGQCLAARVRDRFGDYGTVGLVLYSARGDLFEVDTFLLSCRVLGRGVEHQVLAHCGRLAMENSRQWVLIPFRRSEKNQPAWEFLHSIGAEFMRKTDAGATFQFPAAMLAELRYDPDLSAPTSAAEHASTTGPSLRSIPIAGVAGSSEKVQQIADTLSGVKEICASIETFRARASAGTTNTPGAELPTTLAGRILRIWRKALANPRIGMNDNFIDVGGTSVKAVQIVAAIRRELRLQVSIVNLFECPTVLMLSEKLAPGKVRNASSNDAMQRGARRRMRTRRNEDG